MTPSKARLDLIAAGRIILRHTEGRKAARGRVCVTVNGRKAYVFDSETPTDIRAIKIPVKELPNMHKRIMAVIDASHLVTKQLAAKMKLRKADSHFRQALKELVEMGHVLHVGHTYCRA